MWRDVVWALLTWMMLLPRVVFGAEHFVDLCTSLSSTHTASSPVVMGVWALLVHVSLIFRVETLRACSVATSRIAMIVCIVCSMYIYASPMQRCSVLTICVVGNNFWMYVLSKNPFDLLWQCAPSLLHVFQILLITSTSRLVLPNLVILAGASKRRISNKSSCRQMLNVTLTGNLWDIRSYLGVATGGMGWNSLPTLHQWVDGGSEDASLSMHNLRIVISLLQYNLVAKFQQPMFDFWWTLCVFITSRTMWGQSPSWFRGTTQMDRSGLLLPSVSDEHSPFHQQCYERTNVCNKHFRCISGCGNGFYYVT